MHCRSPLLPEHGPCAFGTAIWDEITVKNVWYAGDAGLSWVMVQICVMYSLVPFFVFVPPLLGMFSAAFVKWGDPYRLDATWSRIARIVLGIALSMATFIVIVKKEASKAPQVSFEVIAVALIFAAAAGGIGAALGGFISFSCPMGVFDFMQVDWNQPESGKHLWRVRRQQVSIKFFIFWLLCLLVKWLLIIFFVELSPTDSKKQPQRIFFISPMRPDQSCATSCTMPSGSALLAYGTLTFLLIEMTFSLMLPHMWQTNTYQIAESSRLGFTPLATGDFLRKSMTAILIFGPVPFAKVLLQDNSPEQVTFGCMFGALLAVSYHSLYMKMLRGAQDGERRASGFRWLLTQWPSVLCCGFCSQAQSTDGQARQAQIADMRQPFVEMRDRTDPGQGHARTDLERGDARDSPSQFQAFSRLAEEQASAQSKNGMGCLPGFEFMAVCAEQEVERMTTAVRDANSRVVGAEARAGQAEEEATFQLAKQDVLGKIFAKTSQVSNGMDAAVREGDPLALEDIEKMHNREKTELLTKASQYGVVEQFDTCQQLIKATVDRAMAKKEAWKKALQDLITKLESLEQASLADNIDSMDSLSGSAFGAFIDCIDLGLNLNKGDHATKELLTRLEREIMHWQSKIARCFKESLTKKVLSIVFNAKPVDFGDFGFPHLRFCLEIINKFQPPQADADSQQRFEGIVSTSLEGRQPWELKGVLENLKSLISFLHYIGCESVVRTRDHFEIEQSTLGTIDDGLMAIISQVSQAYANGADEAGTTSPQTLLQHSDLDNVLRNPEQVIESMNRQSIRDGPNGMIGEHLQKTFATLATQKLKSPGLIMVPHHTQVVALLIMRKVFEELMAQEAYKDKKMLLAHMATGEGKSMVVAALICYLLKSDHNAKVHVIGGRNELVERDYKEFKELFEHPDILGAGTTCLLLDDNSIDSVWSKRLVYTTKAQLFRLYNREAKKKLEVGSMLFSDYDNCYLVVDEVDALVVDGEPNENILVQDEVRAPLVADFLKTFFRNPNDENLNYNMEPALKERVTALGKKALDSKALQGKYLRRFGRDGAAYWSIVDRNGDPDSTKRDNQLSVLNFYEQFERGETPKPLEWLEHSLVMSSPHVFRKYKRILGLSGSLGNTKEKEFVQQAYGAMFMKIPEFMKTCTGDGLQFHEAKWVDEVERTGPTKDQWPELIAEPNGDTTVERSMAILRDEEQQIALAWNVAKMAHKHVPVLVIARDAAQGRRVVDKFKTLAWRSSLDSQLVIGDMTRNQLEESKKMYDANLTSSTQSFGPQQAPLWRITVTDNTGARGTNYAMSEEGIAADNMGGLLLVLLYIPENERDWIQYKGRTARQKWQGQMCAVLCSQDYPDLPAVRDGGKYPPAQAIVDSILEHGEAITDEALKVNRSAMVAGLHMNRWGEQVLQVGRQTHTDYKKLLSGYPYMEIEEVRDGMRQVIGDEPGPVQTPAGWEFKKKVKKGRALLFTLDCSGSMTDRVPGGTGTFLDQCKREIVHLFNQYVRTRHDRFGLYGFGSQLDKRVQMKPRLDQDNIETLVNGLNCLGATMLRTAICESVTDLKREDVEKHNPFLVVLTDGCASSGDASVDAVTQALHDFRGTVVFMTVGTGVGAETHGNITTWIDTLNANLGKGLHVDAAKADAEDISKAFKDLGTHMETIAGIVDA